MQQNNGIPRTLMLWFACHELLKRIINTSDTLLQHLDWASTVAVSANVGSLYTDLYLLKAAFMELATLMQKGDVKTRIESHLEDVNALIWDVTNDPPRLIRGRPQYRLFSLHVSKLRGVLSDPVIEYIGHVVYLARLFH